MIIIIFTHHTFIELLLAYSPWSGGWGLPHSSATPPRLKDDLQCRPSWGRSIQTVLHIVSQQIPNLITATTAKNANKGLHVDEHFKSTLITMNTTGIYEYKFRSHGNKYIINFTPQLTPLAKFTLAPRESSCRTTASWPLQLANNNAVLPCISH